MANNKLELELTVDESGAIKGLQFIQGKAGETADKVQKSFESTSFGKFAESVKRGIEDPLGAASESARGLLSALGPVGTGMAAAVGVMGAFAAAGFEAAKALGEYGDQLEDTATRMGLTVKETAQFTFAMKYAGGSIESLEGSMRVLSQALSESTEDGKRAKEGLKALGIDARDASGALRPMSQIFVELSEKLSGIEDVAKRNTIAIQVLGRAGLQVLPDLLELSEGIKRANEVGIKGPSKEELDKWKEYHHQVVEFENEWALLKRELLKPLAATVIATWKWVKAGNSTPTDQDHPGDPDFALGADIGKRGRGRGLALSYDPSRPMGQQYLSGLYMADWGTPEGLTGNLFRDLLPGNPDAALAEGQAQSANIRATNKAQIDAVLRRWGMSKEGLEAALSEAKKNESEALSKLKGGDVSAIGDFEKASGEVSRLEARIKGLAAAQNEAAKVLELTRKYSDAATSPLRKLFQDVSADTKGLTGAGREQVEAAGLGAILRETAKMRQKEAEEAGKAALEMATALEKADESIRESLGKAAGFNGNESNSIADMMRTIGSARPNVGTVPGPSYDQRTQSLNAAEQAQERIVQLLAGPGGELAAISQISSMRASLAAQEKAIAEERANSLTDEVERAKALYDAKFGYEEKLAQIQRDNAIQILELQKRREDSFVNSVTGGFRALRSGGRSGFGSFVESGLMGLEETALGNVTRMGVRAISGSGIGFSPDSLLGKVFAGSPLVKAGDVQLTAAQLQYKAATIFASSVGFGGAGAGGVIPGVPFGGVLGGIPGLFNGASRTNPFIFSANTAGTPDIAGIPGTGTANSPALNGTFNAGPYYNGKPLSAGMRAVGIAGAVAGGAIGTYEGIQQGGVRGALTAGGSLSGAAGAILGLSGVAGPAAPILAGVGLALGLSTMLFGDPKKKYAESEQRMLDSARYTAPESSTYTFDKSGRAYDYDAFGGMRVYVSVTNHVSSMDSGDVSKFLDKNSDHVAETVRRAIGTHGGLRMGIQAAVNP